MKSKKSGSKSKKGLKKAKSMKKVQPLTRATLRGWIDI
jgi:hypothetical protein